MDWVVMKKNALCGAQAAACAALFALPFATKQATAAVTLHVEENPVPDTVVIPDGPKGMVSYDLKVTSDTDVRGVSIKMDLSSGGIYNSTSPFAGNTRPLDIAVQLFPFLAFDTFVDMPGEAQVSVLGEARGEKDDPIPPGPDPAVFGPNLFSVSWGDTVDTGPAQNVLLARITTFPGTTGAFHAIVLTGNLEQDQVVTEASGPIPIPEPGTLSLLGLAGVGVLYRRRK